MKDNSNRVVILVLLGWRCFAVGPASWFHDASVPAMTATMYYSACPARPITVRVRNTGGLGDIVVAVPVLALVGSMRAELAKPLLLVWNVIGLVDIIFVVLSALRFGLRDW